MSINNQKGQIIVEAVLLMVLMVSLAVLVSSKLREMQFAQKVVAGPWVMLNGMIECGVWTDCSQGAGLHPSTRNRNISLDPEGA